MNSSEILSRLDTLKEEIDGMIPEWARLRARSKLNDELIKVKLSQACIQFTGSEAYKKTMGLGSQSYMEFLEKKFLDDQNWYVIEAKLNSKWQEVDVLRSRLSFEKTRAYQDV